MNRGVLPRQSNGDVDLVPHYEFGFQNAAEPFNNLDTAKVWRFHFALLDVVVHHMEEYLAARARPHVSPERAPWPFRLGVSPTRLSASPNILIRRTFATGRIALLGHEWLVDSRCCHRLVRAEVDLAKGAICSVASTPRSGHPAAPRRAPLLRSGRRPLASPPLAVTCQHMLVTVTLD